MSEPQKIKSIARPEVFKVLTAICAGLLIVGICAVVYTLLLQLSVFVFSALMLKGYFVSLEVDMTIIACALVFLLVLRAILGRSNLLKPLRPNLKPAPVPSTLFDALPPHLGSVLRANSDVRLRSPFAPLEIEDA